MYGVDNDIDRIESKIIAVKVVKARIDHTCRCGKLIPKGSLYRRQVWKVDGEMIVAKDCCLSQVNCEHFIECFG